ncbi:hypothetical protein EV183_004129 [Coemansia sp. RSA 2336]|nr:hypothetical protein EV183_004129 [Coemansia sp. RSA 2336]
MLSWALGRQSGNIRGRVARQAQRTDWTWRIPWRSSKAEQKPGHAREVQKRQSRQLDRGAETCRSDEHIQGRRARRRRWTAWAAGWEFPTLNASYPFTIPTVPAGMVLFGGSGHGGMRTGRVVRASVALFGGSGHGSVPSGVMVPAGLGTAARKFHSMSLTRQPGVPVGGRDEHGVIHSDAAALAAQVAGAAGLRQGRGRAGGRRTDGGGGAAGRSKSFMFAHAATGIPKHTERIPLQGREGEEELATSVGEDAFFHRGDALGIADGVGGWAGVADADPALFARRLMHHVCREVQRYEDIDDELFSAYYEAAPVDVLRRAYEITADEMRARAVRGSSTACVVVLRGDELRVANLGDCGLTVVRQGDMVYRTEEQQHSFNFPYQLGTEPHADAPSDAQVFRLKVQKGDIVVVGSDGVFDNLFDEDILEEVARHVPPAMRAAGEPLLCGALLPAEPKCAEPKFALPQFHVDPAAISSAIARRARLVSEDTRYAESPFQMRAMQEGLYYQGGKRDDITVVVAVVTDLEDAPDRR